MRRRHLILIPGFVIVAMLGYWLAGTAVPSKVPRSNQSKAALDSKRTTLVEETPPKFRREEREAQTRRDEEALREGAVPERRILVFKDHSALEAFLKRACGRVRIMGRLDALNALRIDFSDMDELASLLDGDGEASIIFPVNVPSPEEGTAQPGAVALGAGQLDWLGITGDNSTFRNGVRIAILDTGVTSSQAFGSAISHLGFVGLLADLAQQSGHGTAVASVIIGRESLTPGVAPGANIVLIRIADDLGQSDSYLLAQGIVAVVDAGARLINISMSSRFDGVLVRNALAYGRAAGGSPASAIKAASPALSATPPCSYPPAHRTPTVLHLPGKRPEQISTTTFLSTTGRAATTVRNE